MRNPNSRTYRGVVTPYRWSQRGTNDWEIRYGTSGFLVAQGSGWSSPVGRKLYRDLEAEVWKRRKAKRPGRYQK